MELLAPSCKDLRIMIFNTHSDLPNASPTSVVERRTAPRYRLVAIAELTDLEEGKLISGKVTQISRTGCYVDSPKTLPLGTSLKVIVFRDQRTFVAKAKVIHVQEQIGMGLAFIDPAEDQVRLLESWLTGLPPAAGASNAPPRYGN